MPNQQDEAARRFAEVSASVERDTKNQEAQHRTRKIALALASVFEVPLWEIREIWDTSGEPEQELYESYMPSLRVYHGAPIKWLSLVRGISQTPLWKFFARQITKRNTHPVVTFRVSGQKEFWVMTAQQSMHEELFEPRILVPVKGSSSSVFIMPLNTFVKEYGYD